MKIEIDLPETGTESSPAFASLLRGLANALGTTPESIASAVLRDGLATLFADSDNFREMVRGTLEHEFGLSDDACDILDIRRVDPPTDLTQ